MSDQLIQRWLHDGDKQAAQAVYQAHHERVFRLAYALLGSVGDAQDVMKDTMVYALTRVHQYDPQRASFPTWLHMITVSHCRDRKRRTNPHKVSVGEGIGSYAEMIHPAFDVERGSNMRENFLELWQALARLDPKLREAIVLRYWSGHTYHEIAQILRCPLSTAQSRVRMAYEQLRSLLASVGVNALWGGDLR